MNSNRRPCPAKLQAFTLVELLTVIAIIGILTAIVIPVVGSVRHRAAGTIALANAKQIGMTNLLHAQDNKNQLLGQNDTWNGSVAMFNNMARYISKTPGGNADITIEALRSVVDPLVPKESTFLNYGEYPYTWAINRLFNLRWGRSFEGLGGGSSGDMPRRLGEFDTPAKTLFAVSGGYELTTANAANAGLLNEPVARQAIFYYHRKGTATPAVYLDGHVELVAYPIAARQINPRAP